ncbi:ArfGap-domain-containing protein [Gyrodon lividus]|nr:ArfGap-domain-containing protein [Gyrodon lividus]
MSSSISKIATERNHRTLIELVTKPGNDVCADCKARAPRWASYNIGIFICIHRKIGTHVTKVKSITLDAWSKEQVELMKENGNIKSNALYNPNETRHPPPANMIDSERDSELEKFIRSKYEFKRFMDRKLASQPLVPPRRTTSATLSWPPSTPIADPSLIERKTSPAPPPPPAKTPQNMPPKLYTSGSIPSSLLSNVPPPTRSASQPLPSDVNSKQQAAAAPASVQPGAAQPSVPRALGSRVWDDLISLQGPTQTSSLPLQYQSHTPTIHMTSLPPQPQHARPHPTLNVPQDSFVHMPLNQHAPAHLVSSPMALSPTAQLALPLRPSTPLASPALHLGAVNPFMQPQLTGLSPAFPAGPFRPSLGTEHAHPGHFQPHPQGQPTPSLAVHSAGLLFAQQQPGQPPFLPGTPVQFTVATSASPQVPFLTGPAAHPPFQALSQTPFALSASPVPVPVHQPQPPFSAASPHPAFGATPFLSQQQQQFVATSQFGGWPGQGAGGF